jgi:hypothetical protein
LVWGTDAGKDAKASDVNKIYVFDFETQKRREVAVVGNPVYHASTTSSGKVILGTNFEPGRKQDTPEAAAIWIADDSNLDKWERISEHPYEFKGLQGCSSYGYVYLPKGIQQGNSFISAILNANNSEFLSTSVSV